MTPDIFCLSPEITEAINKARDNAKEAGFKESEIFVFEECKDSARRILEQRFGDFEYTDTELLMAGINFYFSIYGVDEWTDPFYKKVAHRVTSERIMCQLFDCGFNADELIELAIGRKPAQRLLEYKLRNINIPGPLASGVNAYLHLYGADAWSEEYQKRLCSFK